MRILGGSACDEATGHAVVEKAKTALHHPYIVPRHRKSTARGSTVLRGFSTYPRRAMVGTS